MIFELGTAAWFHFLENNAPQHLYLQPYHEVGGGEEAVLVGVHDAEGLLELLDGGVGEGVEDVGLLGHAEAAGSERRGDLKSIIHYVGISQ